MSEYKKVKITPASLGQVLISRCGTEDRWPSNTSAQKRDREFLEKGISFIPEAIKEGADLENTAFVFCFPGGDFAVIAGNHEWEFTFLLDEKGCIRVECTRETTKHWLWNVAREGLNHGVDLLREIAVKARFGTVQINNNNNNNNNSLHFHTG